MSSHQIGHAEDLAERAFHVRLAAEPTEVGIAHRGSLHPIAEHANGGEPFVAGVVPKIAILPIEHFVARVVEIVVEQTDEGLGVVSDSPGASVCLWPATFSCTVTAPAAFRQSDDAQWPK